MIHHIFASMLKQSEGSVVVDLVRDYPSVTIELMIMTALTRDDDNETRKLLNAAVDFETALAEVANNKAVLDTPRQERYNHYWTIRANSINAAKSITN